MLRERNKLILRVHRVLDICLTALAFILAYFIKKYLLPHPFGGLTIAPNYYVVLLIIIIIWYLTFISFNMYASYRKRGFGEIFMEMAKAVGTAMLIMILCMYILKIKDVSRIMLGIFFILNIFLLGLSKGTAYYLLHHYRERGFNYRNVLIIGSRDRAKEVIDTIGDQRSSGFRMIGCLDTDHNDVGRQVKNGIKVIGTIDNIEAFMREEVVDEVIFAMPLRKIENADKYINSAEEMGVSVRIVPDWQIHSLIYRPGIASISFEDFLGIPTMALHTTSPNQVALLIKSVLDYVFAFLAVLLLLPFIVIIAAAIKLSSKGPVLFTQERSGINGRRFRAYKFRTMVVDAEAMRDGLKDLDESDGPVFKIKKDPRIISYIGTFLRKTGLDELPQLINILRGEMSMVGPRPPIPAEVDQYDRWQMRRLSMKPGLTCLWQVSPNRNDLSFDQWMRLDLEYIDSWSLWLDFKIMLRTIRAVLGLEGR
jgi:exopolysaccharide biosynthesis polyprenyl glycosylphosphotransferase